MIQNIGRMCKQYCISKFSVHTWTFENAVSWMKATTPAQWCWKRSKHINEQRKKWH